MPYDFSPEALLHPETRIPFVEAERVPAFNPAVRGFDPANGWWLAGISHLAYHPASRVTDMLGRAGLRLEQVFERAGTFGFIASGQRYAILCFRGTQPDDLRDVLTDINVSLTAFGAGGRVHRGFLRALDRVWEGVNETVDVLERSGHQMWYTGHSLGAALATLAAARRPPAAVVTFGSPLVGDRAFAHGLEALPVFRVVNCCDVVTTVPPEAAGYHHGGKRYFLTARGRLLVDPSTKQVFRCKVRGAAGYATKFPLLRPGMVSFRALADHTIINYAAGLYRALQRQLAAQGPSIRTPASTERVS